MSKSTDEYYRYLAIAPTDVAWGLCVTGGGYQPAAVGSNSIPARPHPTGHSYTWKTGRVLNEFAVLYLTHGKGEFESKAIGLREVVAGDVILLFPGEWHRYRACREVGWGVYWVHFQGEIANNLLNRAIISPERAVLRIGLDNEILSVFIRMLDDFRKDPAGLQQVVSASTLEVLARAVGASRSRRNLPHLKQIVVKAKLMLDEDPNNLPVVDELIGDFEVSRTHFFRAFREHTGLTPYQYHLQLKLRRAGDMLRNSDLSIKQVAKALHFQNPYHFSQLFKRKMGVSPKTYRERGNFPLQ